MNMTVSVSAGKGVLLVGLVLWWPGCADQAEPPQLPSVAAPETSEDTHRSGEKLAEEDAMVDVDDNTETQEDQDGLSDITEVPKPDAGDLDVSTGTDTASLSDTIEDSNTLSDAMGDIDWGPDPSCLFPYGETVTVRLREDGNPVRALDVKHPGVASISYVYDGIERLFAIDEAGEVWWESEVGQREIFGGFDFDGDEWPDVGLVRSVALNEDCGSETLYESSIEFVSGLTGQVLDPLTPQKDQCIEVAPEEVSGEPSFKRVQQWTARSILFGHLPGLLAMSPTKATNGFFVQYDDTWSLNSFVFPSTALFGTEYIGAESNPWDEESSHVEDSHQANGLVVDSSTGPRLVLFTSGRVLQYNYGTYGAQQLLTDHPYVSGNRMDLEGRNEGLVAVDPHSPNLVVLLAGTDANSLFRDRITGQQQEDPWGGTERHITIYDIETDLLEDRFLSNAKDGGGSFQYEGRLAYPMNPFVAPLEENTPSRLAFNVFKDQRWHLHITQPGSTEDLVVLPGLYLWNIQDLDGNGVDEWVITPTDSGEDDVPLPAYLPVWETRFYQWSEESLELKLANIIGGAEPKKVIPYILKSDNESYRTAGTSSFNGHLNALLVREEECKLFFGVRNAESSILEWIDL